jgi:Fur family transcriptional regulator, stress-responsive regulator
VTATPTLAPAEELRRAGLRVTAARIALLETVRDGDHLGVDAIAAGVRDRIGHISLPAVYDALHALTEVRLIRRIEPAGGPPRFEGRVGDNHHHVVCRFLISMTFLNNADPSNRKDFHG